MKQIEIFDYSREAEEEKKQGLLEGQDNAYLRPQIAMPEQRPMPHTVGQSSKPPEERTAETEKDGKSTPTRADEHKEGNIDLNYSYCRFNAGEQYTEAKNGLLSKLRGQEAVYENKRDGTKIYIHKNKIAIDNTPENITAALDIAQDKGWTAINIKGGTKQAQAELWFQAQMRGLDTRGYKPNEQDMKRLLGAQERERQAQEAEAAKQADKLTENLDIKPKAQTSEQPAEQAPAKPPEQTAEKPTEKAQEKTQTAEQPAAAEKQTPETQPSPSAVTADSNTQTAKATEPQHEQPPTSKPAAKSAAEKEKDASADERIAAARKEIMNEVEKYFPLDEEEYKELDKQIEQQLTYAVKGGKGDLNKIKNDIKKGLPMVRQELDQAAKLEQSKAMRQAEKSGQTPSKNPAVQAAANSAQRKPKEERSR